MLPLSPRLGHRHLEREIVALEGVIAARDCPNCDTRRNRAGASGPRARVWYDTALGDWVVRLPWTGPGEGAILPLEIRWFDASQAAIYRAAGDLAFSGDAFEQPPGE